MRAWLATPVPRIPLVRLLQKTPLLALLALTSMVAEATEVEFEGAYRARARFIDTLSLNRGLEDSEGLSSLIEHRLWRQR